MKKFIQALTFVGAIVGIILLFVLEFFLDGIWGVIVLFVLEIFAVPILWCSIKRRKMAKCDWLWVPEGILCILGAVIMVTPVMGPMSDMLKLIVIVVGFGMFMLGLFLDEVVQCFKKFKKNPKEKP
jgi:hypothetical protein